MDYTTKNDWLLNNGKKFLYVASYNSPPTGFRNGELSFSQTFGLTKGVHYDRADYNDLNTAGRINFFNYTAVSASSYAFFFLFSFSSRKSFS
jgi:hypothetical protein